MILGVVKFGLMFGMPWLLGIAIDVVAGTGGYEGAPRAERVDVLRNLVIAGLVLAVLSGRGDLRPGVLHADARRPG